MIKRKNSKVFFGWWTVLFTGILSGLGAGIYDYGGSAFFKPIASELHFSRTTASIASGIGRLGSGIGNPIAGWLVDRFGPRWVIFGGLCVSIAGLASMTLVSSLWSYLLIWGFVIGTAIHMAMVIPVDKTLANWFIKKRGLAQGIKFALISVVGVIMLPVVTWQVAKYDWRLTCLIWSGVWLLASPFTLCMIKQQRPEFYGLLPDGAKVESGSAADLEKMIDRGVEYASGLDEVEFTLRQALRTPAYWLLLLSMICNGVVYGGFTLHCIPFLTDRGIEPTAAGAMMGMMVFFTAPARFFGGLIADRVKKNRLQFLIAGLFIFQMLGMSAFCLNQSTSMIYMMLICYGLGSGATGPIYLTILGRYFGRKAYGSIIGSTSLFAAPIQFASPILAGWIYDTTGNYINAFLVYITVSVIAAVALCLVRTPRAPEHITGIRDFV